MPASSLVNVSSLVPAHTIYVRTHIHTQLLKYVKGLKDILEEKKAKITGLLS